jgi:hydroxymethylpyrimidine/phosphomethylpyrimidine kinase
MKTFIDNCAALTIAGSDSGGGAGIQADLKTFSAFGVFGTSVITAVTAQNLKGVFAIQPIDPEVVQKQLMAVLEGFPIKAIKTGMLFSAEIIAIIADTLANPQYAHIPIIIDPVFAATSGGKLIKDEAIRVLTGKLFPKAALITPNMPETEILLDQHLETPGHLEQAAIELFTRFNVPVLMKGGHLNSGQAIDIFFDGKNMKKFESAFVLGINNHGSGCTLSSAIAGSIAGGQGRLTLSEAIHIAKMYITRALENSLELSPGLRVINHSVCS